MLVQDNSVCADATSEAEMAIGQRRIAMTETADPLVLDFVEWIAREPRAYSEVIGAWKTSCPRLTVWEDAADRGYVTRETIAGFGIVVTVTEDGEKLLRANGRRS
jgi:hypothetical protein